MNDIQKRVYEDNQKRKLMQAQEPKNKKFKKIKLTIEQMVYKGVVAGTKTETKKLMKQISQEYDIEVILTITDQIN